jgi:hypothetical protein
LAAIVAAIIITPVFERCRSGRRQQRLEGIELHAAAVAAPKRMLIIVTGA